MPVVAGIDEAGYGPMLGPLVVGMTVFRLPDDRIDADLWKLCQIGRKVQQKKTPAGVKVADSKVLHRGRHGFRILEENLLPFFDPPRKHMRALKSFLHSLGMTDLSDLDLYPWYHDKHLKLPHKANPQRVIDRAVQLRRTLSDAGVEYCTAQVEVVNVAQFNQDVGETQNKSTTQAKRVAILLNCLWDKFGLEGIRLVVDKQGGRKQYGEFLNAAFSDCEITTELESDHESCYKVVDRPAWMEISFKACADHNYLPVALASMLCKYVRELFMVLFNAYWRERLPGLKPTAGYVEDGRRFLAQIDGARREAGVAVELLVRSR